jgi:N-acyl-D-amino-acid deacylase
VIGRREFVRTSAALVSGIAAGESLLGAAVARAVPSRAAGQRADLLIRGGLVFDGGGGPGIEADVLLSGGRIARFARGITPPSGADVIDAAGLAVAPGFIDIHSHTDTELFRFPEAHSKIRQGVTTEVAGQDGSSVAPSSPERAQRVRAEYARDGITVDLSTIAGFLTSIDTHGAAVNLATMVGAGTLRGLVIGNADRPATEQETVRMAGMVSDAIRGGACGLSSGLEYTPGGFASREELAALASPLAGSGLPYASHMRNEDDALLAAIEEALFVGRIAGVPVQISHLKAQGERNWWKAVVVVETLEFARVSGVDVHFDRYPYVAYSTGLSNLFPLWSRDGGTDAFLARLDDEAQSARIERAVRDKIAQLGSWNSVQITSTGNDALSWARGRRLGDLARERDVEPYALLLEIMRGDRASSGMVGFGMSEENTAFFLRHPLGMVCSDGSALATTGPQATGSPHPRSFGTFPRVLGHYVRERGDMALETAIHKMTGMPAAKLRLAGRGTIAADAFGDIVVFDPDTVADTATFEKPHSYPTGIPHVIVNGVPVIRDGEHTGARPGRAVRPAT